MGFLYIFVPIQYLIVYNIYYPNFSYNYKKIVVNQFLYFALILGDDYIFYIHIS